MDLIKENRDDIYFIGQELRPYDKSFKYQVL